MYRFRNTCPARVRTFLAAVFMVLVAAGDAGAHTEFQSSRPAAGSTVDGPRRTIVLTFSGPTVQVAGGFVVRDGAGVERKPKGSKDGNNRWVLRLDEPLAGGSAAVQWTVQAPDGHPLRGAFTFTVRAVPTPTPGARAPSETTSAGASNDAAAQQDDGIDAFLEAAEGSPTAGAARVAAAGRLLTIIGTLLAIGAVTFGLFVLRGTAAEVERVVFWIRRAGLLVIVGALVRLAGRVVMRAGGDWSALASPSAIGDVVTASTGVSILLAMLGGMIVVGAATFTSTDADRLPDRVAQLMGISGVAAAADRTVAEQPDAEASQALAPRRSGWLIAGVALLLVAYDFDGHTVTEGPRLLTAAVDIVHLATVSIWVGGVLMLVGLLRRRRTQRRDLHALHLAARFSVVAAVTVVAAGLSGVVLTVLVLDAPSALWQTPWGRLLLAKVLLVLAAAGIGGYNHRVLIPAMERRDAARDAVGSFRVATSVEAGLLLAVAAVTALLVGAAS